MRTSLIQPPYIFLSVHNFLSKDEPKFLQILFFFILPFIILLKQPVVFSIITKRTALCVFLACQSVNYNDLISS